MQSDRIANLLIETGAYTDLDQPVILTSGELGIYYINTEKLCQDQGEFKKHANNSGAMIQHAIKMTEEHQTFNEVISILKEDAEKNMQEMQNYAISGLQRRDWLFSGPVAHRLNLPHISVYKNGDITIDLPDGETKDFSYLRHRNITSIHISDLLTEGSSAYRIEKIEGSEKPKVKGSIPEIRKLGIKVNNLIVVVDRLQNGKENLAKMGVTVESKVDIDEEFLKNHSKYPERALAYKAYPKQWSESYLKENGALAFVDVLNPKGDKFERGLKFLERYRDVLKGDAWDELNLAVLEKYRVPLK